MSERAQRPRPPVTDKQALWDERIGPLLNHVWRLCDEHDIPFVAAAQTQPDACATFATGMSEHAMPVMQCVYGVVDDQFSVGLHFLRALLQARENAATLPCVN